MNKREKEIAADLASNATNYLGTYLDLRVTVENTYSVPLNKIADACDKAEVGESIRDCAFFAAGRLRALADLRRL